MRCVVRPRNKSQTAAGTCAQGPMLFNTGSAPRASWTERQEVPRAKKRQASERMERARLLTSALAGRGRRGVRSCSTNHSEPFGWLVCSETPAESDQKWEERGLFHPPRKGVPLIRRQRCSSQRQLPPPDVIHSPPFKINHSLPPSIPATSKWHHLKGRSASTKAAVSRAPTEEKELAKEKKKMKKKGGAPGRTSAAKLSDG